MAKSATSRSGEDVLLKTAAEQLDLSKKSLKKAVREATLRLAAEKIARERVDSSWQEISARAGQLTTKARAQASGSP